MKKLWLLIGMALSLTPLLYAQKLLPEQVPQKVKDAFKQKYSGIKCNWEKEGKQYEGNFKIKGVSMSVLYDSDGHLIETEEDIKITDLPVAVINYIKEKKKGYVIKEAAKITKASGTVNFEAEVNHKDLIFDAEGKFIKEVND